MIIDFFIIYLKSEFRDFNRIIQLLFFSFLNFIVFSFLFSGSNISLIFPAVFWSASILGSVSLFSNSFQQEYENGILERLYLTKISPFIPIFSKFLVLLIILFAIQMVFIPFSLMFFNISFSESNFYLFTLTILVGDFGYLLLTTFFSYIMVSNKSFFNSIIIFPIILPLILTLLKATYFLFPFSSEFFFWFKLLLGFDILYASIIYLFSMK
ncbi:heme exporter protein CcmB [bacterium]|nr:heme exporter protein CcmB [bacterium]